LPAVRSWRRALAAVLVLGLAVALGGCGIPADGEPHPIQPPAPYGGNSATAPSEPSPEPTASGTQVEVIYLTRGDSLARVVRPVESRPTINDLIAHLTQDPTAEEQAKGLVNNLTVPSVIVNATIQGGIVTVALGEGLDVLTGRTNQLAYGQIVCTLDAHPDVTGVVFTRDGEPQAVPRGDGSSSDGPLTIADYETVLEPR
jgi:hypothetical protein